MDGYQRLAFIAAVIAVVLGFLAAIAVWVANFRSPWQIEILKRHYAAIVGLPSAAAGSFILITIFRQFTGEIEVDVPGFALKGAAGPLIFWVVCFLAIAWAIKTIWPLTSQISEENTDGPPS